MSEYNVGDLVEAVRGEDVARSRLVQSRFKANTGEPGLFLEKFPGIPYVNSDEAGRRGWTFRVIEKTAPPLPTEPGWYLSCDGFPWEVQTNEHGSPEWYCDNSFVALNVATQYAPFTRLEPVPATARRVINRLLEELDEADWAHCERTISDIAAEFGADS